MESVDNQEPECFEDLADMMDYSYEKLQDAVYHFCLCTKMGIGDSDQKVIKTLLMLFVESEFDDVYSRLTPLIEKRNGECAVYGIIKKKRG